MRFEPLSARDLPLREIAPEIAVPAHGFGMTPNVSRPCSVGRLTLADSNPATKPLLDFRYFTDEDDHDGQEDPGGPEGRVQVVDDARACIAPAPHAP